MQVPGIASHKRGWSSPNNLECAESMIWLIFPMENPRILDNLTICREYVSFFVGSLSIWWIICHNTQGLESHPYYTKTLMLDDHCPIKIMLWPWHTNSALGRMWSCKRRRKERRQSGRAIVWSIWGRWVSYCIKNIIWLVVWNQQQIGI